MSRNTFLLTPMPPLRLDLTVWTLRRRAENAVDRWDGKVYRRVLPSPGGPVDIAVTQIGSSETPKLQVKVVGQPLRSPVKTAISSDLQRLLGLSLDLGGFYRFAARRKPLSVLARRFRGMKPPRFASIFEAVINAIACQQLTLTVGILLLNRLAKAGGLQFHEGTEAAYAFPRPEDLVKVPRTTLRKLGFSQQKGRAIIELARAVAEGRLDLESLATQPHEAALAGLRNIKGIGRWSAEYVLLRAAGRVDLFPGDDVGARNNLQKWLNLTEPLDYDGVQRILKPWRPYGGLIYFHLLLDRLADAGCVQVEPGSSLGFS
jgi:DNA-3-methyladenine glycosylase II